MDDRERELEGMRTGNLALHWYGWGSPVGLGSFALLLATAVALLRLAFR